MPKPGKWPSLLFRAGLIACLPSATALAEGDENRQGRGHEGRRQAPPPPPVWRGWHGRGPFRYDRGE